MSPRQLVGAVTLCLISSVGAAGCGGANSSQVRSTSSSEFQADAPQPEQVDTRPEPEPKPEPQRDEQSVDEDNDEPELVRRPLTEKEKKSVVSAYQLEKKKAIAEAREQRRSEDRLTRGIHERELAKITAQLRARTRELRAAKKAGTMSPEALERKLEAARKAAELAREEAARTKDHALEAAAALEDEAVQAAETMFEDNCKALDQATVTEFDATAR